MDDACCRINAVEESTSFRIVTTEIIACMHSHTQTQIRTLIQTTEIPRAIWIAGGVVAKIETLTWDEFWEGKLFVIHISSQIQHELSSLRQARLIALRGKGNKGSDGGITAYCYAYFRLLHRAIHMARTSRDARPLLHRILAFEVVTVCHKGSHDLAAILTHRHPGYLLSRIKYPQMPDDPKYLPLIVAARSERHPANKNAYYHYRQLKLSPHDVSLLCYLPVDRRRRTAGFECYHSLNSAIRCNADPRSKFRAHYIADLAVDPFLSSLRPSGAQPTPEITLADVGSGSGDLMRRLCIRSAEKQLRSGGSHKFSVTLVDIEHHKPRRHLRDKAFFRSSRHFRCVRADFRKWIDVQHERGLREFNIVLMCRLLNNASRFDVEWMDDQHQVSRFTRKRLSYQRWQSGSHLPHRCLAPEDVRRQDLWVTNARLPLLQGHTYSSASLSDYYQGIWLLDNRIPKTMGRHPIFYFARRFSDAVLVDNNGMSLIGKLCRIGMLIVIEDVDLTAQVLRKHLKEFQLDHLAASDLTDRRKMHTSQLLCICDLRYEHALPGGRVF